MNMISTGAFLPETDASTKQNELVKKLTSAWEKKNSKTARAGGASLMALSLAACGGEDNTPFSAADVSAAEAAATTAALTGADGTVYASVDAAVTSNDTAIADAARAEGVASVDITTDNQAAIDAAVAAVDLTTDNAAATDAAVAADTAFASLADLVAAYNALATPAGVSTALASTNDVVANGAGNDTITGTSTTYNAGDVITDNGGSDTLNLTLTGNAAAATVVNIETINAAFNTFAAPTFAAANVSGATINVTQTATGGSADATVTGLGATNTVNFGSGVTGTATVTVTGAATVNGGDAATLAVNGLTSAGATIVADDDTNTINLDDDANGDADDAVTISAAGTVALDIDSGAAGADVENLTLSGNGAAVSFDIADDSLETVTVTGDHNVTITASGAMLDDEVLTDNSTATTTVVVDTRVAATYDLDRIAADVIELGTTSAGAAAMTIQVRDGQNVSLTENVTNLSGAGGANNLTLEANVSGATAIETLNLRIEENQSSGTLDISDFEVVNITVDDEAVPAADNTLTVAAMTAGTSTTINVTTGDDNLTLTAVTADKIVATGFNGDLTVSTNANVDDVTGGNGADTFTLASDAAATFNGGAGNDTLNVAAATLGNRTVVFDGGTGTDDMVITTASAVGDRYTLTDVEIVTFNVDSTLDARDFSGKTLTMNGDTDVTVEVVTFSAANTTTVDLSGITINTVNGASGMTTIVGSVSAVGTAITGTNGVDAITGGTGADTINGGAGADDIDGGSGADVIDGGAGDDSIDGTVGATITLGAGNDEVATMEGTTKTSTTTITDFTFGAVTAAVGGDKIDISEAGNTAGAAGGAGVLSQTDDDGSITVVAEDSTSAVTYDDGDIIALSIATFADYDTQAEVATLFATGAEFAEFVAGEEATLFIAAADTGHTYVWDLEEASGDQDIADGGDTVALVGILEGVSAADLDLMVGGNIIA